MLPQPGPAAMQEAQEQARAQFRAWWHTPHAVVVDTETTGLGDRAALLDFAAVPLATEQITPAPILSFLCQPPENAEWSEAARAMHQGRPTWAVSCGIETFSAPLRDVLCNSSVLAYGAKFETDRLRFALTQADADPGFPAISCVMETYAPLVERWSESRGLWKAVRLEEACRREGVDTSDLQPHTAYGDAVATARLIRAVATRPEVF